jgi:hypothetical protein
MGKFNKQKTKTDEKNKTVVTIIFDVQPEANRYESLERTPI